MYRIEGTCSDFFKILDGVDQATIQIRHHRMLSLVPSIFHPIMGE